MPVRILPVIHAIVGVSFHYLSRHDFAAQQNTEHGSCTHTRTTSQTITSGYGLLCQHCSIPPQMLDTSYLLLSLAINRTAPEIPTLPQDFRRRTFVAHLYRYSFVLCSDKTKQLLNLFNKLVYSALTQIQYIKLDLCLTVHYHCR